MSDLPKTGLPLEDVPTPTLDAWDARLDGGWSTWVHSDADYRIHAEQVDLEVPPDVLTYATELRLEVTDGGRPYETVVRETVHNPYLALRIADELAGNAARYADAWEEGLAPRPTEVKHVG